MIKIHIIDSCETSHSANAPNTLLAIIIDLLHSASKQTADVTETKLLIARLRVMHQCSMMRSQTIKERALYVAFRINIYGCVDVCKHFPFCLYANVCIPMCSRWHDQNPFRYRETSPPSERTSERRQSRSINMYKTHYFQHSEHHAHTHTQARLCNRIRVASVHTHTQTYL